MRVRFVKTLPMGNVTYKAGDAVELSDDTANYLMGTGYVVRAGASVEAAAVEPQRETTAEEPPKRRRGRPRKYVAGE